MEIMSLKALLSTKSVTEKLWPSQSFIKTITVNKHYLREFLNTTMYSNCFKQEIYTISIQLCRINSVWLYWKPHHRLGGMMIQTWKFCDIFTNSSTKNQLNNRIIKIFTKIHNFKQKTIAFQIKLHRIP